MSPHLQRFALLTALLIATSGVSAAAYRGYVELPWAEHGFDLLPNGLGSQVGIGLLEWFLAGVDGPT